MTTFPSASRSPDHPVDPLFVGRWSPRAMSGESISHEVLMSLFEAARWAPSSYNNQPWRFLYAHRGTPMWDDFVGLLYDGNKRWATAAGVLLVILSKKTFDRNGKPSRTHSFDAGAAWENLALQATRHGLVAHGMEGFDVEAARRVLDIPGDTYEVEAMVAVGMPSHTRATPDSQPQDETPSGRKSIDEIAFEGALPS